MTTGIVKTLLKIKRNKKEHIKVVLLARSKLNSTEKIISKALLDNEISHEDFTAIINEEKNYQELNEIIRLMKSQRNDTKKNLIEEGKRT